MSAERSYYNCDNIDESIKFPLRKAVVVDSEVRLNAIITYLPSPMLQKVNCDEDIGLEQLLKMICYADADGNTAIRLFYGI